MGSETAQSARTPHGRPKKNPNLGKEVSLFPLFHIINDGISCWAGSTLCSSSENGTSAMATPYVRIYCQTS